MELAVNLDDRLAARAGRLKRRVTGLFANGHGAVNGHAGPAAYDGPDTPERRALVAQVAETEWYHTLDLGHGVLTPGFFDHRPHLHHYHLPASLEGMRALDVATYNGFWAFEFERRGAAEVIGLDIERFADIDLAPARRAEMTDEQLQRRTGRGFEIASTALGSRVRREICNVYDLSPAAFGLFDVVFCGDLLLHLTNPVRALQRICSVTRGWAYIAEMYDPYLDRPGQYKLLNYHGGRTDYVWWTFGFGTLQQMIADAGFDEVEVLERRFDLFPRGYTSGPPHVVFRARRTR
jgi:tRNA (mo5U34)-methyltransferase